MIMDLIKDIATISSIPYASLIKLFDKAEDCICYGVDESIKNFEELCKIDVGFGYLYIKYEEDKLYYKFSPSLSLEKKLVDTLSNGSSPLVTNLEKTISSRIMNAYKELL